MTNPFEPSEVVEEVSVSQQQMPPSPPPPVAKKQGNGLGITSLVLAIVGAIAGVIPGFMIIGWILLPIAAILGIVAIVVGRTKGFGIAGLVIGIIGAIASAFVFLTVVGTAIDSAFMEETATIIDSEAIEGEDGSVEEVVDETTTEDAVASDELGTRDNPVPLGTEFETEDWRVVVNSVDLDATALVEETNQFNDAPKEGFKYIMAELTATYIGLDKSSTSDISVAFVGDNGNTYRSFDHNAVAPEPSFGMEELYTDGSFTGNIVFEIPVDATGTLRVEPGFFAQEIFVATN